MAESFLDKTGLTYFWGKIKDYVANAVKVTGVKGNSESTYRTGNVNITVDNIGALAKNPVIFSTNPFRGTSSTAYISKIDNAFYRADKRWTFTCQNVTDNTAVTSNLEYVFNGSYENGVIISRGKTYKFTMDFTQGTEAESDGAFPEYPYGYIYLSFYNSGYPVSISARCYCNYATQGVGWKDLTVQALATNTTTGYIYRIRNTYYKIQYYEFTITAKATGVSGDDTRLTQIEMFLDRPSPYRNPFVSKYNAEKLYFNLTAPKFIGALQGNADTSTNASKVNNHTVNSDVPSNAVFTDTTYSFSATVTNHVMSFTHTSS